LKFSVGDMVSSSHYCVVGKILRLLNKDTIVLFGSMSVRISVSILEMANMKDIDNSIGRKEVAVRLPSISSKDFVEFDTNIDLHGVSVLEGLVMLDKWLDKAILMGYKDLKIIHGKGSGVMKKAVHKYLSNNDSVNRIIKKHPLSGGDGVTWVNLK